MKQTERVRDYFGWLNKTNTIIMDAYEMYTILPAELVLANQADTLAMRAYVRQSDLSLARFFLMNHFQASLPSELH